MEDILFWLQFFFNSLSFPISNFSHPKLYGLFPTLASTFFWVFSFLFLLFLLQGPTPSLLKLIQVPTHVPATFILCAFIAFTMSLRLRKNCPKQIVWKIIATLNSFARPLSQMFILITYSTTYYYLLVFCQNVKPTFQHRESNIWDFE